MLLAISLPILLSMSTVLRRQLLLLSMGQALIRVGRAAKRNATLATMTQKPRGYPRQRPSVSGKKAWIPDGFRHVRNRRRYLPLADVAFAAVAIDVAAVARPGAALPAVTSASCLLARLTANSFCSLEVSMPITGT